MLPHHVFPTRRLLAVLAGFSAAPLVAQQPVAVVAGGQTYVSQGLVGVGRIPAALKDKFGETFGSFSAFAFDARSWQRGPGAAYQGTLYAQPDRGYNIAATTNYTPRFNKIAVAFTPAPSGSAQQNQVVLTLTDTVKFTEADGTAMTSLDPTSSGTGTRAGFPALPQAFNGRLSLDAEGIVVNPDGTLWVSDEYGPYVYKFAADGKLLAVIRPPEALVPKRGGADSFASNNPGNGQPVPSPADPVAGRQNNQGLEGLSVSPDGKTLFALLQSATRQDGGTGGNGPRRHTRLLAYDLSTGTPVLKGHYVLQLPTYEVGGSARVPAQSELLAINSTQFLVLARDGNGRGTANPTSLYRSILVYDLGGATNLLGTPYDATATAVAPGGVLVAGIAPLTGTVLINMNDAAQLAKFGLTNGPADTVNNLSEKWEALALVPALDPQAPHDYFLFVGNDNDFLTTAGFQDGAAYAAALDNDSMVLVYRLTLPGRLLSLSSRARVGTGVETHIVGFNVSGPKPKALLVRGIGPGLAPLGVTGALLDPAITLFNATGQPLGTNDNWGDANGNAAATSAELVAAAARSGAFALTAGSKDAALLVTLDPGTYTVHLTGVAGGTGIGLAEIYELP